MSKLQYDSTALKQAIQDVRDDTSPTTWVLVKDEEAKRLVVAGSGTGSVLEMVSLLDDTSIGFGLVRVVDQIDASATVKFVFINWLGMHVPPMQKARLTTHKGEVLALFRPYHVDISADCPEEVSDEIVLSKVRLTSGSDSRVKEGAVVAQARTPAKAKASYTPTVPQQSESISFVDEEAIRAAIADVRNDDTPTDWVLVGYAPGKFNMLELIGSGVGGLDAFKENLREEIAAYGIFRMVDKIDESLTVKFVFVTWIGESVKPTFKARISSHKGSVNQVFAPYHRSIDTPSMDDLNYDDIMRSVQDASGSGSRVLSSDGTRAPAAVVSRGMASRVPAMTAGKEALSFDDTCKEAIASVRNDKTDENWALLEYVSNSMIGLVGMGSGGLDELKQHLKEDQVQYGILRVLDKIDDSLTVKFVLIQWVGGAVKPTRKALISTHRGAVTGFFAPFHNEIHAETAEELNEEDIMKKVMAASGSLSSVKP